MQRAIWECSDVLYMSALLCACVQGVKGITVLLGQKVGQMCDCPQLPGELMLQSQLRGEWGL